MDPSYDDDETPDVSPEDEIPDPETEAAAPGAPEIDPRAATGEEEVSDDPNVAAVLSALGEDLTTWLKPQAPAPAQPAATAAEPAASTTPAAPVAPAPAPAAAVTALFSDEEIQALKGEYGEQIAAPLIEANKRVATRDAQMAQMNAQISRLNQERQLQDVESLRSALVWANTEKGLEKVFGPADAHFDTLSPSVQKSRVAFFTAALKARDAMAAKGKLILPGDGFRAAVTKALLKGKSGAGAPAARPSAAPSSNRPRPGPRVAPATATQRAVPHRPPAPREDEDASRALQKKFGIRA